MAKARDIPFAGLSELQGHRLVGTQLVIFHTGAGASASAATTPTLSPAPSVCATARSVAWEGLTELRAGPTV